MTSILNNSGESTNATTIARAFTNNLLNAGRKLAVRGIGLSASSRDLAEGFISASQTGFNSLFSFATGPSLTIEGLQTQIKGLRASLPVSRISPSLLEDNGNAAASSNGRSVDTTA